MTDIPIALDAYEALADVYAAMIDTKPHNAYCERPATLSLLPPVDGARVFDAGCGSGVYSDWLLAHGATVVAADASPRMVELTRTRTGGRAEVHVADLAQPFTFLDDASCDLVVCPLVLEYVREWRPVFAEFRRVLSPGGHLVVSVTHPFSDATQFKSTRYHDTELVRVEWRGFAPVRVTMPSYRRSLAETLNPFADAGFRIERLVEPKPTAEFRAADPRHYAELMLQPCFLCVRAVA